MIIPDPHIKELCERRLHMFGQAKKMYNMMREYYRLAILNSSMKRIYINGTVDCIDAIINLQTLQITKFCNEREKEIVSLIKDISEQNFTEDEIRTLSERTNQMRSIEQEVQKLQKEINEYNDGLKNAEGLQIKVNIAD